MTRTILYVAWAPFFSGAERALLLLLEGLDRTRYRPFVIVGHEGELQNRVAHAGIPLAVVPLHRTDWRKPVRFAVSTLKIAQVARSVGAALIHSNETPGFQPAGYAARLLGIPIISHIRFPDGDFRWFLKPAFTRAVFISQHMWEAANSDFPGFFSRRRAVIHDSVRLPRLVTSAERAGTLRELGISPEEPTVLLTGQVAEIKGIWEYIEAARLLVASGVQCTFVVMGDDLRGNGALRRAAEERVSALGMTNRFRFIGFRRDAATLVGLFGIIAVPSHVEPLGLSALEAMAAARPVVASRVGGLTEVVVDGETGLLVPPRDPAALASALRTLLDDAEMRERFGAAGRQRAATVFSIQKQGEHIQALYDELLAVIPPQRTPDGRTVDNVTRERRDHAAASA